MQFIYRTLVLSFLVLTFLMCSYKHELPKSGICAHRGAKGTFPENTIPAFKEAIRLGVNMIEFDVWPSKDGRLVVIHDESVDRTTNGSGMIAQLNFEQIENLDAGSWKDSLFSEVRVPTFEEVIKIMPKNIWINIHIKKNVDVARRVAEIIVKNKMTNQSILAIKKNMFETVKRINENILTCNMDRVENTEQYVEETIKLGYDFIQLTKRADAYLISHTKKLIENGIKINYYGTNSSGKLESLFASGINFVLVDEVNKLIDRAKKIGLN